MKLTVNSRRSQLYLLLNRQFAHAPTSFELSSGLGSTTHMRQVPLLSLQKLHGSTASVPRVCISAAVNAVLSLSGLRIGWPSASICQSKTRIAGNFWYRFCASFGLSPAMGRSDVSTPMMSSSLSEKCDVSLFWENWWKNHKLIPSWEPNDASHLPRRRGRYGPSSSSLSNSGRGRLGVAIPNIRKILGADGLKRSWYSSFFVIFLILCQSKKWLGYETLRYWKAMRNVMQWAPTCIQSNVAAASEWEWPR